jgi:hypothetical protein
MAELDQWIFQEGHAQSVRPKEYVRLSHARSDSAAPITRYDVNIGEPGHNPGEPLPVLTNKWTGGSEFPPLRYNIADGSAEDPFGENEGAAVFEKDGHRQIIWFPTRVGMVTRWQTILGPPYNVNVEWCAEAGPGGGFGQSVGAAEFPAERLFTPGLAGHNLNYGGAVALGLDPLNPDVANEVKNPASPVLHHKITDEYVESVVIPFHFIDGENRDLAYIPHGMTAEPNAHSALLWRHRQYQRATPCYLGDPFVTLLTTFFYAPEDWDDTAFDHLSAETLEQTTPFFLFGTSLGASAISVMHGIGMDQGWYADVLRNTAPITMDDFPVPATPFHGDFQDWTFNSEGVSYRNRDTGLQGFVPGDFAPSRHLALAHARSSDGFAVGICGKIGVQPTLLNVDQERVSDGFQSIFIQSWDTLFPVNPGLPVPHHGQQLAKSAGALNSGVRRFAGWIGNHLLFYTGPISEMITRLKDKIGVMAEPVDVRDWVPPIGREGTEAADVIEQTAPPIEQIRLSPNSTFSSRLR